VEEKEVKMYSSLLTRFIAKFIKFILISVLLTSLLCVFQGKISHAAPGYLDTSFGTDGIVITSISDRRDHAYGIAIQGDGKILVSGCEGHLLPFPWEEPTYGNFSVVRYNSDVRLDTGFGTDGIVTTSVSNGNNRFGSIAIQDDGKIVIAGGAYTSGDDHDFAVVRYNSDGSLDTSFGTYGIVTTSLTDKGDFGLDIAIQADGKIVVSGVAAYLPTHPSERTYGDFAVVRYNSDGSLDT
jgi:uncharacterized delta-60 repeat protein